MIEIIGQLKGVEGFPQVAVVEKPSGENPYIYLDKGIDAYIDLIMLSKASSKGAKCMELPYAKLYSTVEDEVVFYRRYGERIKTFEDGGYVKLEVEINEFNRSNVLYNPAGTGSFKLLGEPVFYYGQDKNEDILSGRPDLKQ